MSDASTAPITHDDTVQPDGVDVDVLVVGAGISGIGAAHHLREQRPDDSFLVLEKMGDFGGTWRTHTYPGVRSDSDLHTFGYRFKPWTGNPIATGQQILDYLGEVIEDDDLEPQIRYHHRIDAASWDGEASRWSVVGVRTAPGDPDDGVPFRVTCRFLWMCQGYYDHDRPHTPTWEGFDDFAGTVVHPQRWPDDLDWTGKRIVVIGSGATAATLIPNLADDAEHVTMLQRSPTYFINRANVNELGEQLRALDIPAEWTHEILRRQALATQHMVAEFAREAPDMVREELFKGIREVMGEDFDVSPHFDPDYRPWQQRLCLIPDGDLFHALKSGKASVVTDTIERFTPTGIDLASGEHLEADVVVTATGFDFLLLGGIAFDVDGEPVDLTEQVSYRGMMFTGVPNLAWVMGYFRASWTLKVDLMGDFVCRLLAHLDEHGCASVTPTLRPGEELMDRLPWVDPEDFNPGYLLRAADHLPARLPVEPWNTANDYWIDKDALPAVDLATEDALVFE